MVYEHGGLALNLFKLKAVRMERAERGGYLIFEFHNIIREVLLEKGSDLWESRSYEDAPISQYFDDVADLELHYHEWTGLWFSGAAIFNAAMKHYGVNRTASATLSQRCCGLVTFSQRCFGYAQPAVLWWCFMIR